MGWVAPSIAVADGTMDCDSAVVYAARWSHMASGDGMVHASGLYHSGLPVMVEWVTSSVVIADSTTTTENSQQSFHDRLFCFVYVCGFSFITILLFFPLGV